jgi:predicted nucleotidyltransferase component of viral defense system
MFDRRYDAQVRLLLRCLPEISQHPCFALKGGTAINLFLRDLPRISVDIDLTYLSLKPRPEALQEIHDRLVAIKGGIEQRVTGSLVRESRSQDYVVKLLVSTDDAIVKIEPNLIFRGSVYTSQDRDLCLAAQEHFEAFVSVQALSIADLYGGKLCAALDRQHPRDLFDVKLLLEDTGITPEIRRSFVVYLAGHNRPMSELLAPKLHDIGELYVDQFKGMTRKEVSLEHLRQLQKRLANTLIGALDDDEKEFLVSLKRGKPEWGRMRIEHLSRFPAIQWKLINIRKMGSAKQKAALDKLFKVLST